MHSDVGRAEVIKLITRGTWCAASCTSITDWHKISKFDMIWRIDVQAPTLFNRLDTWMCFSTVILIGQYGLDGTAGNVSRTSGNLFSVTASWFTRSWHGGFVAGSYTYFVVLDVSTSATRPGMRVLRVCDNSNETSVAAMYEAEINCFTPSAVDASSMLQGASLLESFPSGGTSTLVIGLSTPNVSPLSRVCTVELSSINSSMNSALCSPTSLPWRTATTSSLSCPNGCTISSPGAIGVPISDTPNAAYLSTSIISIYTSTLAFNYESLALLFIVNTDDTGAFIQEVSVALNESKKIK